MRYVLVLVLVASLLVGCGNVNPSCPNATDTALAHTQNAYELSQAGNYEGAIWIINNHQGATYLKTYTQAISETLTLTDVAGKTQRTPPRGSATSPANLGMRCR